MTGDLLTDLAVSFGGIAFLVGFSIALGGLKRHPLGLADAKARLSFDEPDFRAVDWIVDRQENAALASAENEIALVFRMGDNLVTRRSSLATASIDQDAGILSISLDGLMTPLELDTGSEEIAVQWVGRYGKGA